MKVALASWGLPGWWIQLVLRALAQARTTIFAVEVFAGVGEVSKALTATIGLCRSFDCQSDPNHDILRPEGLAALLCWIVEIRPGGLLWMGVPCATWVALSRASTLRSMFLPRGPDDCSKKVFEHNVIQSISSFLMLTATALQISVIIEQPQTSLLFARDFRCARGPESLYWTLKLADVAEVSFFMEAFGGSTRKGMRLVGTAQWLHEFNLVAKTLWGRRPQTKQNCSLPLIRHRPKARRSTQARRMSWLTVLRTLRPLQRQWLCYVKGPRMAK